MRTFRCHLLFAIVAAGCATFSAGVAAAQSRLLGDVYTFSAENFPDDFGVVIDPVTGVETDWETPPVELTFDGVEEEAGGMLVNERVFEFEGIEGGLHGVNATRVDQGDEDGEVDIPDWESPGEVIEFSFRTANGGWIAQAAEFTHSFYAVRGLDWANSVEDSAPSFFNNTFYFWYGQDGVPIDGMATGLDTGIYVTDHPFDESIPEVAMITYGDSQVEEVTEPYFGGMDFFGGTTQLSANASYDLLAQVMSLEPFGEVNGRDANEFHVGFLVTPPESAVSLLAGDVNLDGKVDLVDFNILKSNFNLSGEDVVRGDGDLDGDMSVDLVDFNILKANFGASAAVPEPTTGRLALAAAVACYAWRRYRRRAAAT